jgi:hypothetical protein
LELKRLKGELERMESDPSRTGQSYEETKITGRIVELNHREEIMWQQRSHIRWLATGDKNTRFFHLCTSQRRNKNKFARLHKPYGQFTEDLQEPGNLATVFYKELYTSEGVGNMEAVIGNVPSKVTEVMNSNLIAPFEEKEVKEALF